MSRAFFAAAAVAVWVLWSGVAGAHVVGMSQSDFTVEKGGTVRALIAFSKADAVALGRMDRDHDGVISPSEVEASAAVFGELVRTGVRVRANGVTCPGTLEGGGDTENDGFGLSMVFACPEPPGVLDVELSLLGQLPAGHRDVLRITAGAASVQKLVSGDDRSASLDVGPAARTAAAGREGTLGSTLAGAIKLGVVHILTGWDHLLFLAALLLGARELRGVVAAVTAFTAAHSITLALAALGVYAPSPRLVEPLIAASIAYVAFENAFRARPSHRWRITFVFGLVHGFGFAGALRELTLSRERLVPVLLGFNVGVEIGQLAFIAVALPALALLRRYDAFEARWVRRVSVGMGIVGASLFVARIAAP